ncbi:MAG: TIGR02281 family clan AA aspartic protease [Sphingomonas sp.]|uniref:retropepsin-like aspartic protease family protein n=1 Tax=Sphingomonas sp. TaxID=28214 RepID=UPI001AD51EC8|nr:TIGR02281 family clan AA aspartic protease [Sphingomonas sp.]MBN8808469.1 TIGR02281 family clan AA aspartic protease [Sphingomonas sp.]
MKVALVSVMVVGVAIGLAWPSGKPRGVVVAPVPAASSAATTRPLAASVTVADVPQPTVIERQDNGHFSTVADVNGEPIKFVVDTGASVVALTQDDARRAGVQFDPAQFTTVGTGAGGALQGQEVELRDVVLDGKRVDGVRALVIDGLTVSLLGQNFLRHLDSVAISGDTMTLK